MATEMIEILQKMIAKHGDKPIRQHGYYAYNGGITGVTYNSADNPVSHALAVGPIAEDCFLIDPAQMP